MTDFTDTITVKMFVRNDQLAELLGDIKKRGLCEDQRGDDH